MQFVIQIMQLKISVFLIIIHILIFFIEISITNLLDIVRNKYFEFEQYIY